MQKSIVILYTRMPRYFLDCLKYFVRLNPSYSVFCLCHTPSADAPFLLNNGGVSVEYLEKLDKSVEEWANEKSPSLIFVAGWANRDYLKTCKRFVSRIPVVVGMDNLWNGSLKQRFFSLFSGYFLKTYFNHIWVPGSKHEFYARKLGFSPDVIRQGLYCCESIFNLRDGELKSFSNGPKELLFVGRFVDYKRPQWLVSAFKELKTNPCFKDWKLKMIGNGPLKGLLTEMTQEAQEYISILDFQQSEHLRTHFLHASAFCLPSANEHWGVVVHEAASMGLPLLISDSCGAYPDLLEDGLNGFVFRDGDTSDFKNKLGRMLSMPENEFSKMSEHSKMIAGSISLGNWSKTMLGFLS
ncbi:MAG: glycosyltransferase family 4 protein [Chitinophagaceae bacterium]|nr:glycosyltransferase family 4 protein [Chitinophagaceae bacterium]